MHLLLGGKHARRAAEFLEEGQWDVITHGRVITMKTMLRDWMSFTWAAKRYKSIWVIIDNPTSLEKSQRAAYYFNSKFSKDGTVNFMNTPCGNLDAIAIAESMMLSAELASIR